MGGALLLQLNKASGVLLHPTSLPSKYGIGELGQEARDFVDFLKSCGLTLWQVLPLNPIGYGESPYQAFSAFAGNPLLISLDTLQEEGFLTTKELAVVPSFPEEKVDYAACQDFKEKMLRQAYKGFRGIANKGVNYQEFMEKNTFWLADYALFMALKEYFHYVPWNFWDKAIALREPEAIKYWEEKLSEEINYQIFLQYEFDMQWKAIRAYAVQNGIKTIGDLPIYVAYDSSDTWVYPHLFELDDLGNPLKVGGVPPDYFSATGQLWGNPLYKWGEMEKDDYLWWRERIKALMDLVDIIRVDHFRGFEAYWEVPASELTAINGRWVQGPGEKFFRVLSSYLGELPLLAEDLGIITPQVVELKDKFAFPGMKVLQFIDHEALGDSQDEGNWAYYTGTHDNDTLLGWLRQTVFAQLSRCGREKIRAEDLCWELIEIVMQSRAKWAIIPLQDFLCLNSWARMNTPGTVGENWEWRFKKKVLTKKLAQRIKKLVTKYGR